MPFFSFCSLLYSFFWVFSHFSFHLLFILFFIRPALSEFPPSFPWPDLSFPPLPPALFIPMPVHGSLSFLALYPPSFIFSTPSSSFHSISSLCTNHLQNLLSRDSVYLSYHLTSPFLPTSARNYIVLSPLLSHSITLVRHQYISLLIFTVYNDS